MADGWMMENIINSEGLIEIDWPFCLLIKDNNKDEKLWTKRDENVNALCRTRLTFVTTFPIIKVMFLPFNSEACFTD